MRENYDSFRTFLKKTFAIVIPVMLHQMLNSITNLVDTFMIGKMGELSIAGVGLAAKVFFVLTLIVFGTGSGLSVLAAQYWGQGDRKRIREATGIALSICTLVGILFMIACLIHPVGVMHIFTNDGDVAQEGAEYLFYVSLSYPMIAVSNTVNSALCSIGKVRVQVVCSCIGIAVNVFLNYCLIFGHFGAPRMGVAGAGIATAVARFAELTALAVYLYRNHFISREAWHDLCSWEKTVIGQFVRKGSFVLMDETLWGIGITMYSLSYGRMGEQATAVMSVVETFTQIELIGIMGLSTSTAILLGNTLGEGKLEEAKRQAEWDMILALLISIILGLFTFFIRDVYISIFDVAPETAQNIRLCMLVYSVAVIFRSFNTVTIVGILRSGGDTLAASLIDLLPIWFFTVPMVFLAGLVWKMPIYVVFIIMNCEEFLKLLPGYLRVKQYKWVKNLNVELTQNGG